MAEMDQKKSNDGSAPTKTFGVSTRFPIGPSGRDTVGFFDRNRFHAAETRHHTCHGFLKVPDSKHLELLRLSGLKAYLGSTPKPGFQDSNPRGKDLYVLELPRMLVLGTSK